MVFIRGKVSSKVKSWVGAFGSRTNVIVFGGERNKPRIQRRAQSRRLSSELREAASSSTRRRPLYGARSAAAPPSQPTGGEEEQRTALHEW
ncbi:hypothetical protein MRX96_056540 [Rhipicephalus microplus]